MDGDYILEIQRVDSEGKMEAGYFNQRVGNAEAKGGSRKSNGDNPMKNCARVLKICLAVLLFAAPQVSAWEVLPFTGPPSPGKAVVERPADTIYFGGPILTMEGDSAQYTEALAVKDGKILFVGEKDGALALQADRTRMVDLKGRTMLPGFIDAHGHVCTPDSRSWPQTCCPLDIAALEGILKDWAANNRKAISKVGWIIGFGYPELRTQYGV